MKLVCKVNASLVSRLSSPLAVYAGDEKLHEGLERRLGDCNLDSRPYSLDLSP